MQVSQGHSHLAEVSQVAGGPPAGRHGAAEVVGLQADDGHVGEAPTGCPGLRQAPGQLVAADIQHLQSLHIRGGGSAGQVWRRWAVGAGITQGLPGSGAGQVAQP